jgi:GNAT superfamily N-acetyltransferase
VAIQIRPVDGMDQLERWVAVQNAVYPDDPETTAAKALIRAQQSGHLDLIAYVDGEPAGAATLSNDAESQRSGRPWVDVTVLPAQRGRGVGSALFGAVSEYARERGASGLMCEVRTRDVDSQSFLTRRGFVEEVRFRQCTIDLGAGAPRAAAVPGVELAWLSDQPSLLQGMYEVAEGTYGEIGGNRARNAERFVDWQVYELGDTVLDAVPVALAGGRVIGFATIRKVAAEGTAELRTVAVLPEWRRKGVASALLAAQLARARDAGLARVIVWVRDNWPLELFRRLGFEEGTDGAIVLRGPLL